MIKQSMSAVFIFHTFELIPSLAMLGMAAAVIASGRGMDDDDDDEDGEWR